MWIIFIILLILIICGCWKSGGYTGGAESDAIKINLLTLECDPKNKLMHIDDYDMESVKGSKATLYNWWKQSESLKEVAETLDKYLKDFAEDIESPKLEKNYWKNKKSNALFLQDVDKILQKCKKQEKSKKDIIKNLIEKLDKLINMHAFENTNILTRLLDTINFLREDNGHGSFDKFFDKYNEIINSGNFDKINDLIDKVNSVLKLKGMMKLPYYDVQLGIYVEIKTEKKKYKELLEKYEKCKDTLDKVDKNANKLLGEALDEKETRIDELLSIIKGLRAELDNQPAVAADTNEVRDLLEQIENQAQVIQNFERADIDKNEYIRHLEDTINDLKENMPGNDNRLDQLEHELRKAEENERRCEEHVQEQREEIRDLQQAIEELVREVENNQNRNNNEFYTNLKKISKKIQNNKFIAGSSELDDLMKLLEKAKDTNLIFKVYVLQDQKLALKVDKDQMAEVKKLFDFTKVKRD